MQNILENLIRNGEGEALDFKQTISNFYKIAKTISSFANSKGGNILVGVKDDGKMHKIDPEEEKYMLQKAADFYCKPPVKIHFRELEEKETGHIVLQVVIKESSQKPHYSLTKKNNWIVHIRYEDKSIAAGKTIIQVMQKGMEKATGTDKRPRLEKHIIDLISQKKKISLKEVSKQMNISERRALRALTKLVLDQAITLHEFEKDPFYTL